MGTLRPGWPKRSMTRLACFCVCSPHRHASVAAWSYIFAQVQGLTLAGEDQAQEGHGQPAENMWPHPWAPEGTAEQILPKSHHANVGSPVVCTKLYMAHKVQPCFEDFSRVHDARHRQQLELQLEKLDKEYDACNQTLAKGNLDTAGADTTLLGQEMKLSR